MASPLDESCDVRGAAPLDDGLPRTGDILGAYTIEHRLGQGGMAAVFAARHRALGKRVAIKMLLPHNASRSEIARRFVREGEAAARLDHPHVVGVSDVGTDARGAPFLVMEYLDGEDLAARLARDGKLDVEQTVDLLLPVVSAVAAAHDAGIVHRDLKPQNIFLARERNDAVPKVLDFGISKLMDGDESDRRESLKLTGTGTILGTPYYISPEQAQGARKLDGRTDQFSLGVIMYECVTGKRPFEGGSLYSVIANIVSAAPVPPSQIVYPLAPEFEALVNRALNKDPAGRFADMRELGRALLPLASFRTRLSHASEFGQRESLVLEQAKLHARAEGRASTETRARERSLRGLWSPLWRLPTWLRASLLAAGLLLVGLTLTLAMHRPGVHQRRAAMPPPVPEHSLPSAPAVMPSIITPSSPTSVPRGTYHVSLTARPAMAVLRLDGTPAGRGALERELPVDGVEHVVEASLPGHQSRTLRFRDAPPSDSMLVLLPLPTSRPKRATLAKDATSAPTSNQSAASETTKSAPRYGTNQAVIVR